MKPSASMEQLLIEPARSEDLSEIVDLERIAWPSGACMRAEEEKFSLRIRLGMLLARSPRNGQLVGFLSTFRPRWLRADTVGKMHRCCPSEILQKDPDECWELLCRTYNLPRDWHDATDDGRLRGGAMHDPSGDVLFGIGIATRPEVAGQGIAQRLLRAALLEARRANIPYFFAYGRLPGLSRYPMLSAEQYLGLGVRREYGVAPLDVGFRIHWGVGAQPLGCSSGAAARYILIPDSMRDDPQSAGFGFLVVTPTGNIARYPFEALSSRCASMSGSWPALIGAPVPGRFAVAMRTANHGQGEFR